MKPESKRFLYLLQTFASLLGIVLSLYLLVQHTRLKSGIQGSASFCSLGGYADCDVVNASQYSEVAGIPLAAIGAVFYFLLLLLAVAAPPGDRNFRRAQRWLAWMALLGLCADLALFIVQLAAIKSVCIVCLGTYLATLLHLCMNVAMAEPAPAGTRSRWLRILAESGAESGRPERGFSLSTLWLGALAIVSYLAAVALLPFYLRLNSETYAMVNIALEQFYRSWKERPGKPIEPADGDGVRGNPAAKVRIVEFSDFECPYCRRAAFTLHAALHSLEGKIYFVFKNFPLDSTCNTRLTYQLHPNACNLARLGYCAQKAGKFWQYHDLVYMKLPESAVHASWSTLEEELAPVFTKDEIAACLQDPKSLASVTDSIKLGNSLGIAGTPSVYIDGKLVTIPLTVETVRKLVEIEGGD